MSDAMRTLLLLGVVVASAAPSLAQCEVKQLGPPGGPADDGFGTGVAYHAVTVLVGAPWDDDLGTDTGAVHVFERDGADWIHVQKLTASDGESEVHFGGAMAVSGDTAIIGAPTATCLIGCGPIAGLSAAYVFEFSGGTWTETDKLAAWSPGATTDFFGMSVAIDGDRCIVGAPAADSSLGAAYTFQRGANGWEQDEKIPLPPGVGSAQFGAAVAIAGDCALVTGYEDHVPALFHGTAAFFERTDSGWELRNVHPEPVFGSAYGHSAAMNHDTAVVGAVRHDLGGTESGAVHVFRRGSTSNWGSAGARKAQETGPGDRFGSSVRFDGSLVVIGAPERGQNEGAAYVFQRSGPTIVERATLRPASPVAQSGFGEDVDLGDGLALVGAAHGSFGPNGAYLIATDLGGHIESFCFCPAAPTCDNPDSDAGCANSTGVGAVLEASGATSVSCDELVFTATDLPADETAFLFMGGGQVLPAPMGAGQICVNGAGPGRFRFPTRNSGPGGAIMEGPGLVAHSLSTFPAPGQIAAGKTWHFQVLHRDRLSTCSPVNLTNAVSVTFAR